MSLFKRTIFMSKFRILCSRPGYEDVFDITERDNIGPVGKGCRDNCLEVKPKDLKGRCCYPDFSVSNGIKLYTSISSTNLKVMELI